MPAGGYIVNQAHKRMVSSVMRGVACGAASVAAGTVMMPLFAAALPFLAGAGLDDTAVKKYFQMIISMMKYGIDLIETAPANYRNILARAEACGKEEYWAACFDIVNAGDTLGGLSCGEEWLYSSYGLLCRWEEVAEIRGEFFFADNRLENDPFKWAAVRVTLANGKVIEAAVTDRNDIAAVSEDFVVFAREVRKKGIAVDWLFKI